MDQSFDRRIPFVQSPGLSPNISHSDTINEAISTGYDNDSGIGFLTSTPNKNQSMRLFQNEPYFSGRTQSQEGNHSLQPSHALVDETIQRLIAKGDEEFQSKYSKWISEMFHLQIVKMHRRLADQYNIKMESVLRGKQQEFLSLQNHYKLKLSDLEESTKKFYKTIQSLRDENIKLQERNDAQIEGMQNSLKMNEKLAQIDLEAKLNLDQAKCEKEKQRLIKDHSDQVKELKDRISELESKGNYQLYFSNDLINESKCNQNKEISDLKAMNEQLSQELNKMRLKLNENEIPKPPSNEFEQFSKEDYLKIIKYLKMRVNQGQKEKSLLLTRLENSEQLVLKDREEYLKSLQDKDRVIQDLKSQLESEQKEYESKLKEHSSKATLMLNELKDLYGEKIQDLKRRIQVVELRK